MIGRRVFRGRIRILRHHGLAAVIALTGLAGPATSLFAGTNILGSGSAEIYAGAGESNNSIDSITFDVPGAQVGNGAEVLGLGSDPYSSTLIDASARSPRNQTRTAFWTVDSSVPLTCATPTTCGSTTIPMNRFRWVVSIGNEIADGTFNGSTSQALTSFSTSRYIYTYMDYYYANTDVLPSGRYSGRIVYTVTMP